VVALTSLKAQDRLLDRQAANSIRQQIVIGAMPPGHRLVEVTLAGELEVSRGTIRSALSLLANDRQSRDDQAKDPQQTAGEQVFEPAHPPI
jgi:DNA-binding transcriptional MocR family regulator